MKRILAPILLLTLLFPALAFGETMDDLVEREGIFYKKYTDIPFTGKITGDEQGVLEDGKRHGPWVRYNGDGQLLSKGTLKDGKKNGPWVKYHKNGQLLFKGTYKDGKMDGLWVTYNEDGTVDKKNTGTFKDGVKVK
jgi:antitoxin component YwqK of YwqJK toxin-antitoxin module